MPRGRGARQAGSLFDAARHRGRTCAGNFQERIIAERATFAGGEMSKPSLSANDARCQVRRWRKVQDQQQMMGQRKNASVNGGTVPARPRARIMFVTCAVATSTKPSKAIIPAKLVSPARLGRSDLERNLGLSAWRSHAVRGKVGRQAVDALHVLQTPVFALHVCREMNVRSSIRTLSNGATNLPCGQLGLPRISNQVRQRKVLDQVHSKPNVERTACKMLLQNSATSHRRDIR